MIGPIHWVLLWPRSPLSTFIRVIKKRILIFNRFSIGFRVDFDNISIRDVITKISIEIKSRKAHRNVYNLYCFFAKKFKVLHLLMTFFNT